MDRPLTIASLCERLNSVADREALSVAAGNAFVVVDLDAGGHGDAEAICPCPVIGLTAGRLPEPVPGIVDVVAASRAQLNVLTAAIAASPVAALVLVQLLRHNERAGVADGLFAESLAYSSLQHGEKFQAWLAARGDSSPVEEDPEGLVLLERTDDVLTITLNRPRKRNAYSAGLRDALCNALGFAETDETIVQVVLEGAGACFSAGGDLAEFGHATDAGAAHAVRMTRSAAMMIARLRERVTCRVHGACIGAGIELPAFAGTVTAAPDSFFQLPEVAMGLIPGAGGTVSILARIGRLNAAYMALSNERIEAQEALAWGLIDEIVER